VGGDRLPPHTAGDAELHREPAPERRLRAGATPCHKTPADAARIEQPTRRRAGDKPEKPLRRLDPAGELFRATAWDLGTGLAHCLTWKRAASSILDVYPSRATQLSSRNENHQRCANPAAGWMVTCESIRSWVATSAEMP
jgi:hypothetical protein